MSAEDDYTDSKTTHTEEAAAERITHVLGSFVQTRSYEFYEVRTSMTEEGHTLHRGSLEGATNYMAKMGYVVAQRKQPLYLCRVQVIDVVKPEPMDMIGAFRDTLQQALVHGMHTMELPADMDYAHLKDMLSVIESCEQSSSSKMSPSKLGRWLGWAQACVVAANIGLTMEDMKEINKKRS